MVQSPRPVQADLGKVDPHSSEVGNLCSQAAFPTGTILEQGHPASRILSPALSDNMRLSKTWLEQHQSTQPHCQPFLQGGRGAARESDGPSCRGSSPILPSSQREAETTVTGSTRAAASSLPCNSAQGNLVPPKCHCCPPALHSSSSYVAFLHTFLHPQKNSSVLALSGRARFGPCALILTQ